ncbi:MAG TPA: tetratricopeptide repeat protein [Planctomycetota bacterium]|nr:tetratricopeptide repeat protein [Planctomycetota bacterium]
MRVGAYEVLQELGRGGAGVVYRVRSPDGSDLALKLLLKDRPEARARFEREKRILGALGEQEGFVPLVDGGEAAQGPYIVMPFVAGGNLRQRLARGPLPLEEAIELGVQLAAALGRAHGARILHRDLKPENVLFAKSGRPLVADLGIARHFRDDAPGASQSVALTRTGEFLGTVGYAPPEQMRSSPDAGPPTDVFSLGAVLYECITGRPAFVGATMLELLARVEEGDVTPVAELRPDVPAWLAAAIERALESDPADRFATAAELRAALLARGREPGRSVLVPVVVLLALGVTVAGGLVLSTRSSAPSAPPRAVPPPPPLAQRAPVKKSADDAEVDPKPGSWWAARARERQAAGDEEGTLSDLSRAIDLEPDVADYRAVRANILANRKRYAEAIADLDHALALEPRSGVYAYNRAVTLYDSGDWDGAVAGAVRVAELSPELAPRTAYMFGNRGIRRRDAGDLEGAVLDLERSARLGPGDVQAWANLALAYRKKGDLDLALAAYDRALALEPKRASLWENRAIARSFKGDTAGALSDIEQAFKLDPTSSEIVGLRGIFRFKAGDSTGGRADLDHAIDLDPRNGDALSNRSFLRLGQGDVPGALDDAKRAVAVSPGSATAICNRGAAYLEQGDLDAARSDYEQALRLDPKSATAYYGRASVREKSNDRPGAIADYERCIQLAQGSDRAEKAREALERLR